MQLDELIRQRRTIHDYTDEKVEWSEVRDALELGLWSLNHRLTFPWRYYRLGEASRHAMADVMVREKEKKSGPATEAMRTSIRSKMLKPAEVIFFGQPLTDDDQLLTEDYATLACAIQLTSLVLWQKGIGSKWSTGKFVMGADAYKILKLDPEKVLIRGCLFVGKPAYTPTPPDRPSLEKFLSEV